MKDHILEFTKQGTKLTKKRGLLIVSIEDSKVEIPFADIHGMIIISEDLLVSSAVLGELLRLGVCVQILDKKFNPAGVLTPLVGHNLIRSRLLAQIENSESQTRRLWQKVVVQKISNQSRCLEYLGLDHHLLSDFPNRVESGDPTNVEAQAAKIYWTKLFGSEFRRDITGEGVNSFLNYGYAIIRSSVARYVVGAGLNPSLGIFHTNKENPFCLVDDLMEPFRPLVDFKVFGIKESSVVTPEIKKLLVGILEENVIYRKEKKTLRNAIQEYCYSFCDAVLTSNFKKFDVGIEVFNAIDQRV